MENFEFFVAKQVAGTNFILNDQINGFLGLGRSEPFRTGKLVDLEDYTRGPSFVEALYDNNLISTKKFSITMGLPEVSEIDPTIIT